MKQIPSNIDPVELVNLLLVGPSGVGKTHAVSQLDGLWYFTHEADGVPVVRAENKDARIYLLEDRLEDYAFLKDLLQKEHDACSGDGCQACRFTGAQCAADGCRAVAYDGLSEAQRICLNHASEVNARRRKKNADGTPKMPDGAFDELDYNLSYHYLARLLGRFRDVRVPTFVLAHSQDPAPHVPLPGGGTAQYVRWHIPGAKFDSKIPRYFTAIGGMHHRIGTDERAVIFDPTVLWGDRLFRVKPMAGLRGVEQPNPQLWLTNIAAAIKGKDPSGDVPTYHITRLEAAPEAPASVVEHSTSAEADKPAFVVPD